MEIGFSFCDEIEEEILLRLPTKTVSRFKCVSKAWYNRITNSEFAHKHLKCQRQTQANNVNLMLHGGRSPLHSVSCSSSSIYNDKNDPKIIQHNQPLLVDLNDHVFYIFGSYDGLLLVVATTDVDHRGGGSQVIYIWNPTTGEYKTLPQLASYMDSNVVFGFGPDLDNKNHYKVLLLQTVYGETELEKAEFKVNMYTTHTNSWRTVVQKVPFCYLYPYPQGMILAYDNLHYIAQIDTIDDDNNEEVDPGSIISFDLKDDKFRVLLPMPSGTVVRQICTLNGDDLCAFSNTDHEFNIYCIWRMENFGVKGKECWTAICSINDLLAMDKPISFVSPLHFLEDGQILLYAEPYDIPNEPFIVAYNTESKKASFLLQGNNASFFYIPVVYQESFISPNAVSNAEEEVTGQLLKRRRTYMERCTRDALSPTTF